MSRTARPTTRPAPVTHCVDHEPEIPTVVFGWCLRLLTEFKLGNRFIERHGLPDAIARQLGMDAASSEDIFDQPDPVELRKAIRQQALKVKRKPGTIPPVLAANVQRTAELVGLNPVEARVFEFAVLMHAYSALSTLCGHFTNLRVRQVTDLLAQLLNLPNKEVYAALRPEASLCRSGLLSLNRGSHHHGLDDWLELISPSLADRLVEAVVEPTDWLRNMVSTYIVGWTPSLPLMPPTSRVG